MVETKPEITEIDQNEVIKKPGAGFTNWQKAAREIGNRSLARFIETMDPGDLSVSKNSHTAITERLQQLNLPIQSYVSVPAGDFLNAPERYFSLISKGDYYFASVKPGMHVAHSDDKNEIISLVKEYVSSSSDLRNLSKEIYISHNGEPTMSGHIFIEDDDEPNSVSAEFTIGNFNQFHRGLHTPEISIRKKEQRFEWEFRGELASDDDWRKEDEIFECFGGAKLSRPEMARRIFSALQSIPRDGDCYLPGYYEVLLENIDGYRTRPAFIEAVLK